MSCRKMPAKGIYAHSINFLYKIENTIFFAQNANGKRAFKEAIEEDEEI